MEICRQEGNDEVFMLKCVSAYPTPYEEMNLNMIPTLKDMYGCQVGLSDHSMGSTVAVGAAALGIKMVEKHLTLKRSDGGPDAGFSMEPDEFRQMVDEIRIIEKAMGNNTEMEEYWVDDSILAACFAPSEVVSHVQVCANPDCEWTAVTYARKTRGQVLKYGHGEGAGFHFGSLLRFVNVSPFQISPGKRMEG